MGRILLYIGVGYVALVLISSMLVTGPAGLPLLVLVAIAYFLHRGGAFGKLRAGLGVQVSLGRSGVLPPALDEGQLAEAQQQARRFEDAERLLLAALPEDPLQSPALVAVLAAYLHEPPEAQARLEREYRDRQEQFLAWRGKVRLLGPPDDLGPGAVGGWLDDAARLAAELAELEAYADDLNGRAAATDGLLERALERTTRAAEALAAARTDVGSVAGSSATSRLREGLESAEAKNREAWSALEKGKERPLTALRLADEAAALAEDVKRQAARITALPRELERQLPELERSIEQVHADLERVHEEFEAAADSYAPSCWHEIGGFGHAARRALERARRLRDAAASLAESRGVDQLEHARQNVDQARLAVDDAARLRDAIERHLAKLEAAALEGRDRVIQAEQEIDRAWATAHAHGARDDEVLRRAADLVREARDGLAKPQPDWLTIVELAGRAAGLARDARAATSRAPSRVGSPPDRTLEEARAQAKDARDSAWSQALVRPEAAEGIRPLLEAAEDAYQRALQAETVAAFGEAERLAAAFRSELEGLADKRGSRRDVGGAQAAHTLVWNFELTRTTRL